MSIQVPIVNAGLLYVNGLGISWVSNTTLTLAAGAARNSSNLNDIILSAPVTVNGASVGANGVDIAVLAASSIYAVYVIGDSTDFKPTASLLSLSASSPSLPAGYDMFRRVGWVKTDGSSHLLAFWQYGSGQGRQYYWDVPIAVTTANVTSFTAVSLAAGVPPLATQAVLKLSYTPAVAGSAVEFLPYGSVGTVGNVILSGVVASVAQKANVTVPLQLNGVAPSVLYKMVTSDALTTAVAGYLDYLS